MIVHACVLGCVCTMVHHCTWCTDIARAFPSWNEAWSVFLGKGVVYKLERSHSSQLPEGLLENHSRHVRGV